MLYYKHLFLFLLDTDLLEDSQNTFYLLIQVHSTLLLPALLQEAHV